MRAALRTAQGTDDLTVRFETVDPHRHGDMVGRLHAAVERPAWVTRETPELAAVWLSDVPVYRHGREPLRILIAERSEEAVGYALFRRNLDWADAGPQGLVKVAEVVADDPAVAHVLWSRLLDLDLTPLAETPEVFARNTALLRRRLFAGQARAIGPGQFARAGVFVDVGWQDRVRRDAKLRQKLFPARAA